MSQSVAALYGAHVLPRNRVSETTRVIVLLGVGLAWPAAVHLVPSHVPLGPILMPLLLPAALAAFLLPMRSAITVCVGMPLASWMITGMPALPMAYQLVLEGIVLAAVSQALVSAKIPWWLALAGGALAGRALALVLAIYWTGIAPAAAAPIVGEGLIGLLVAGLALPLLFSLLGKDRQ